MTDDKTLTEAMSFAGFMDVKELRALYYGRLDIYVSFTDDWKFETSGTSHRGDLNHPTGIVAHSIDAVVGRKVGTHLFYARVFRVKMSGRNFINDIKHYTNNRYNEDKELLTSIGFFKEDQVLEAIESVEDDSKIRTDFERIWNITRILAESKGSQMAGQYWREIFVNLGYDGFNDPSGTGIIGERSVPTMILLNYDKKEDFDIVHVQKYRTDKRNSVVSKIVREIKRMKPRRDRVAKMKKEDFHKDSTGLFNTIADMAKVLFGGGL